MSGRNRQGSVDRRKSKLRGRRRSAVSPKTMFALGLAAMVIVAVGALLIWRTLRPTVPEFDENRAFSNLEHIVAFGPRVPGSEAHRQAARWITTELARFADQVTEQPFRTKAGADSVSGTNIVASFNLQPERNMRIMLSAHWDTRPWADADNDSTARTNSFDGANDSGSGVAVLLEIARVLAEDPLDIGVDILLFDLEDYGRDTTVAYALGSEHFASTNAHYRPTFGINLDMICDENLRIPKEANSVAGAGHVVRMIWEAAEQEDADSFVDVNGMSVMDDHIPFLQRGIPVVDLIHLPFPDYWHTAGDTIDKCSRETLDEVGRVVLRVIYTQ